LDEGLTYTQVAADTVVATGVMALWLPPEETAEDNVRSHLDEGIVYTQIAAGHFHTVLLRSDGSAVAVGLQRSAVCKTPADIRRSNVSISHSPYVFAPMATALHKSGCSWGRVLSFDCTGD